MEFALKVLIGVIAAVAVFSIVLIKFFSFLIRKGVISFTPAPVPATVSLEYAPEARWQDEFELDKLRKSLARYDLTDLGYFTIYEMPGVVLNAFVKPESGLYVVIYEHPEVGQQWVDFVVLYQDGDTLTISSAKLGHELEQRPGHDKIFRAGASTETLYEIYAAERRDRPVLPLEDKREPFVQHFQRAYKEEMEWRNQKQS